MPMCFHNSKLYVLFYINEQKYSHYNVQDSIVSYFWTFIWKM